MHTIMTVTPQYVTEAGLDPLAARAVEHVWMHFTRMSGYADGHVPVIVRGEGAYVWDDSGKRYLDGLVRRLLPTAARLLRAGAGDLR